MHLRSFRNVPGCLHIPKSCQMLDSLSIWSNIAIGFLFFGATQWFLFQTLVRYCNGYTVTGSLHSRYTELNIYSSCTRVELRLFVHVSDGSIGCTSHQSLILYIVAINIYNRTRSNRGTGDPLQLSIRSGGGFIKFGPWVSFSWYGVISETWKTGCIFCYFRSSTS